MLPRGRGWRLPAACKIGGMDGWVRPVLTLVKIQNVYISHVTKELSSSRSGLDNGDFVKLPIAEEFEGADQVVAGGQEDGLAIDEVVSEYERAEVLEFFVALEIAERDKPGEIARSVLEHHVGFAVLPGQSLDLKERSIVGHDGEAIVYAPCHFSDRHALENIGVHFPEVGSREKFVVDLVVIN